MKKILFGLLLLPWLASAQPQNGPFPGPGAGGNIPGNAATATVATNTIDGVRVIVNGVITNFFGNSATSFTNAFDFATNYPGAVLYAGNGVFNGDPAIPSITVNCPSVIGSGVAVWDEGQRMFIPGTGTIITNGGYQVSFGPNQCSNVTFANFCTEGAIQKALLFVGEYTNHDGLKLWNYGYGANADVIGAEPVFFSGADIDIDYLYVYSLKISHALILKGVSNSIVNNFQLIHSGGGGNEGIFLEGNTAANGNGNVNHVVVMNGIIDGGTNTMTPISFGINTNSTIDDVVFKNIKISSQQSGVQSFNIVGLTGDYSNSVCSHLVFDGITANSCPGAYIFFSFNSFPSNSVWSNNIAGNCILIANGPSYPANMSNFGSGDTNFINMYNITIVTNGGVPKTYYGNDTNFFNSTYVSALNVIGGANIDALTTASITAPGTVIKYLNEDGANTFMQAVSGGDLVLQRSGGGPIRIEDGTGGATLLAGFNTDGSGSLSKGLVTYTSAGVVTGPTFVGNTTNTLAVGSSGLTNNTANNYLLTITAGTGLALKDGNGNGISVPVLGDTVPLKPGWRFTGTAVTAQCYQFP